MSHPETPNVNAAAPQPESPSLDPAELADLTLGTAGVEGGLKKIDEALELIASEAKLAGALDQRAVELAEIESRGDTLTPVQQHQKETLEMLAQRAAELNEQQASQAAGSTASHKQSPASRAADNRSSASTKKSNKKDRAARTTGTTDTANSNDSASDDLKTQSGRAAVEATSGSSSRGGGQRTGTAPAGRRASRARGGDAGPTTRATAPKPRSPVDRKLPADGSSAAPGTTERAGDTTSADSGSPAGEPGGSEHSPATPEADIPKLHVVSARVAEQAVYRNGFGEDARTPETGEAVLVNGEDTILTDEKNHIYGVFDGAGGMGGNPAAASQKAAEAARDTLGTMPEPRTINEALDQMRQTFTKARAAVRNEGEGGSTTALVVRPVTIGGVNYLVYGNAGDCRAFIGDTDGTNTPINTEQGKGREVSNAFTIKEPLSSVELLDHLIKQAEAHPDLKTQKDRDLTVEHNLKLREDEFGIIPLTDTERVMICSDGITGDHAHQRLTEAEMREGFSQLTAEAAAEKFLQLSKKDDDKSVIVIDMSSEEIKPPAGDAGKHDPADAGTESLTPESREALARLEALYGDHSGTETGDDPTVTDDAVEADTDTEVPAGAMFPTEADYPLTVRGVSTSHEGAWGHFGLLKADRNKPAGQRYYRDRVGVQVKWFSQDVATATVYQRRDGTIMHNDVNQASQILYPDGKKIVNINLAGVDPQGIMLEAYSDDPDIQGVLTHGKLRISKKKSVEISELPPDQRQALLESMYGTPDRPGLVQTRRVGYTEKHKGHEDVHRVLTAKGEWVDPDDFMTEVGPSDDDLAFWAAGGRDTPPARPVYSVGEDGARWPDDPFEMDRLDEALRAGEAKTAADAGGDEGDPLGPTLDSITEHYEGRAPRPARRRRIAGFAGRRLTAPQVDAESPFFWPEVDRARSRRFSRRARGVGSTAVAPSLIDSSSSAETPRIP